MSADEPQKPEEPQEPPKRKRKTKKEKTRDVMEETLQRMVASGMTYKKAEEVLASVVRWRKDHGHI